MLRAEGLSKQYQMGEIQVDALIDATFTIKKGEFVVILGPSGSGKSTLLNIIGGMDEPTSGKVFLSDREITGMSEGELTDFRRDHVGFVFQFYNLMASLTAEENVELATELVEGSLPVLQVMEAVGLADRLEHFPSQLSGGEQQRVSIARAIAKNPEILLCDEPTGALDFATGVSILDLLRKVNLEFGKTVVVITHNQDIALMADRVIRMRSGRILSIEENDHPVSASEIRW